MDKYDYKMKYVPQRGEVNIFSGDIYIDECKDTLPGECKDYEDILLRTAISAVESMLCMCSMVFMKCMEDPAGDI